MRIFVKFLFCVLFLHVASCQVAVGLNSTNVVNLCAKSCAWETPEIWSTGQVPNPGDFISLIVPETYTIQVNSNVTVGDLNMGIDDSTHTKGHQTLEIMSGAILTSLQGFDAFVSTTVIVDTNASFIITGAGHTYGALNVYGFASFGSSLKLDTKDLQIPPIVYASLTLQSGTVVAAGGLSVSSTSNVIGSGNITADIDGQGNFFPGKDNAVGLLNVTGALTLASSTILNIDVASANSFDHIIVSGICTEGGKVLVSTLNSFVPLSHQYFYILNFSESRQGFSETTADCPITCLPGQNKWGFTTKDTALALIYNDATTILISFFTITLCLFSTLL